MIKCILEGKYDMGVMRLFLGDVFPSKKNNFDLIRFIAAVAVIFSHSFPLNGAIEPTTKFFRNSYGGLAVSIFIFLSGFLVMYSWSKSEDFSVFIKARILRIFPALIFVVFISAFVLGPIITTLSVKEYFRHPQTYQYLRLITLYDVRYALPGVFANNAYKNAVNGSLWTLEYEFSFYIILGILGSLKLLKKKYMSVFLFSIVFVLATLNAFPGKNIYTIYSFYFLNLSAYFCMGMIYYDFRKYIPLNKSLAGICMFMLILSSFFGGLNDTLFIIFGSYLIIFIGLYPNIKLPQISKAGDFSYGIYIYAFPVQQTIIYIFGGKMNPTLNFLISFPLTLLCAILSWHFIEKRFLKLKKYSLFNLGAVSKVKEL